MLDNIKFIKNAKEKFIRKLAVQVANEIKKQNATRDLDDIQESVLSEVEAHLAIVTPTNSPLIDFFADMDVDAFMNNLRTSN